LKLKEESLNSFDTLKIATQYWYGDPMVTTIIAVIFFLLLALFFILGFMLQKRLRERNIKRFFESFAKEKGLTSQEQKILWEYSRKMERDPILVLEFKAPFERVIDFYIKNDPSPNEKLVAQIRKKLGFEVQSPFVPLITTKDIEIFQNARMILPSNKTVSVALYDKDEHFMYWAVIDGDVELAPLDEVKIVFVRQDDGIYSFTLPVKEVIREGGKVIVKLPHTFELNRIQRREYPRIKFHNKPVKVIYLDEEGENVFEGKMIDLGAGGARVCVDDRPTKLLKIGAGEPLKIIFSLEDREYELESKVLEKDPTPKEICFRLLFEGIDEETKHDILEFVQREQLRIAQLKRESR